MNKVHFLLTNFFILFLSLSAYAQNEDKVQKETESIMNINEPGKTTVVVNEKMLQKYKNFMNSGEYTSLWETVKDYNMNEMSTFYHTYKNYAFSEETSYKELKLAAEKNLDNDKMDAFPIIPEKEVYEYLSDFQEK